MQLSNFSSLLFSFYIIILVLSYGVVVGENIIVPDFTRISLLKRLIVVRSVDCYLHLIFAPHFLPPSYPSPSSPHTHTHTYTHTHTHTQPDDDEDERSPAGIKESDISNITLEDKEPYDTVVLGPDGIGYVWSFRGKKGRK